MSEKTEINKIEEIYLVLSDLRYLMHRESNTLAEYQRISEEYYHRIATTAAYARDMLPADRLKVHDEQ